jgi:lysophospholipase L1-like esterase
VGRRRKLALGLLIGLGPFFLLELGLRVYYGCFASLAERRAFAVFVGELGVPSRYLPHPYLAYALNPAYTDASGLTHHDPLGFRGPAPSPRPDRVLIAALGGSTTYTVKVADDAQTYPAQLGAVLRERTHDDRIQVLNAGVPGYTSYEVFVHFAFRVLDQKPSVIVLYEAVNDLHARGAVRYLGDNSGYRKAWSLEPGPVLSAMRYCYECRWVALGFGLKPLAVEHYTRHQAALPAHPPPSLLAERPPVHFRRNLVLLVRLARAQGVASVLCTFAINPELGDHYASQPFYVQGIQEMNRVIGEVAREEGALLVDVAGRLPRERRLWVDGVHVSEAGARVKAEIIAEALAEARPWEKR